MSNAMVVLKDLSIGYKTKKDVKVVAEGLSPAQYAADN